MNLKPNLSIRAQENLQVPNIMLDGIKKIYNNKFHLTNNPSGIINMSVAENQLMTKELSEIMGVVNTADPKFFGYSEGPFGTRFLRDCFANNIFNRHFKPHEPIRGDHIVLSSGCSATIDNFTFSVCDPGDGVLFITPYYGGFDTDIIAKAKAKAIPVYLEDISPFDVAQIKPLQAAVDKAFQEGTNVRALILSNPHNPLGRNYTRELIIEYLKFANKNRLHILFDEIYALSVFDHLLTGQAKKQQPDNAPFISVLSIPNLEEYCDKQLIHVAYGMSKDFCLNGYRCGCLVSPWNRDLLEAMRSIAVFTWMSSVTEGMLTELLSDPERIDTFIKTNQARLAESYTYTVETLSKHNISFTPAQAGLFLWIDLRQYIPAPFKTAASHGDREAEFLLWRTMLDQGVYLNLGGGFSERKVGFFRLTFSLPLPILKMGLDRVLKACLETTVATTS
ncbi:1-aminocyclopropane-1-carboxylate synthase, partial [Lobosporangium transversale]